jgi:TPR repeat protein
MQAPTLDITNAIQWNDADQHGKFNGTKTVTAKIGENTRTYTITIKNAQSKDAAEALLNEKIHEIVSVALMYNVSDTKSLVYKGGHYSTVSKDGENTNTKEIKDLNGGFTKQIATNRAEKAKNKQSFYEKILPIIKGKSSSIDQSVKDKITNKEKLTHEDLKKIDKDLKAEFFDDEIDTSALTAEIVERKKEKWKQAQTLAKTSFQVFNLKKADKPEPTPQKLHEQGVNLLYGRDVEANEEKGIELLKQAAAKNFQFANYELAYYYFDTKKENDTALEYGLKAAEAKLVYAQQLCGDIYGEQENLPKSIEMYQAASEQDHPAAHLYLGQFYKTGKGVDQSDEKSKEHYEAALRCIESPNYKHMNKPVFIARIHLYQDDTAKAKEVLEQAENNEDAKKLLAVIKEKEHLAADK